MPARIFPQSPKPGATANCSCCHARSRLKAAEGDSWPSRVPRGQRHGPRRGRRSALVAGQPAMGVRELCSSPRAGPPRKVFPTSAASTEARNRARATSAARLAGARCMSRVCGVPRAVRRPRPPQPCTLGGAPSSSRATRGSHRSTGRPYERWHRKPQDRGAGNCMQGRRGRLCR